MSNNQKTIPAVSAGPAIPNTNGWKSSPWTANLTNTEDAPWLDLFVCGWIPKPYGGAVRYKTKEGRINKGKWREMKVGDYIEMKDRAEETGKWAIFQIVAKHEAPTFPELVKEHWHQLAPHLKSEEEVVAAYQAIVDTIPNGEKLVEENGVVAVEVRLIAHDGFGF